MLDRTIPFCNTIMKCSDYEYRKNGQNWNMLSATLIQ